MITPRIFPPLLSPPMSNFALFFSSDHLPYGRHTLTALARPKSIRVWQQLPQSSQSMLPSHNQPSLTSTSFNRTIQSIELLHYYLNSPQHQHQPSVMSLSSGSEFVFICQSNGSWPPASIDWLVRDSQTANTRNITHLR